MPDDIITAIDTALGCQWCGHDLGASPSDDFCSPRCQESWHAARTEPLVHYDEPRELAAHVGNPQEQYNPETSAGEPFLPPGVGVWLEHALHEAPLAHYLVSESGVYQNFRPQRIMFGMGQQPENPGVEVGWPDGWEQVGYTDETHLFQRAELPGFRNGRTPPSVSRNYFAQMRGGMDRLAESFREMEASVARAFGSTPFLSREPESEAPEETPRERALRLRQNRNTGPSVGPAKAKKKKRKQ